ncbi:MAG: DoxX family protein [Acidobacteria bacterium]|nr:DoxX family protein [Acidobacteriota bacterium]
MLANSKAGDWAGRIITTIVVLFLIFDGVTKTMKDPHVLAASADLGFSVNAIAGIGGLLLGCTLLYIIPRTAILGAIFLTGYLGGAVAVQVRVSHPIFQCLFPVIFGGLVWAGVFLRDAQLRRLIPVRKGQRPR